MLRAGAEATSGHETVMLMLPRVPSQQEEGEKKGRVAEESHNRPTT